jgi:predicted Zn-dependent protease
MMQRSHKNNHRVFVGMRYVAGMRLLFDIKRLALLTLAVGICLISPAFAAGLIRDAETEDYLRDLSAPVLRAAGLSPQQVRIFVVSDDSLNAFVAGGSNLFLHTGLMMEADTADMLLGVIAHETGHIVGGHVIRSDAFMERAQIGSIMTYLLGAAAIAAGGGEAGVGILAGAAQLSNRSMLTYTRTNEEAADQAALGFLDNAGISAVGMQRMFERLRREEKQHLNANSDAYLMTHPLSEARISHMRAHMQAAGYSAQPLPNAMQERHARMRAKLVGFLSENTEVLSRYPLSDTSIAAHMARAVMYANSSDTSQSLAEVNAALKQEPRAPYLNELKGYILFKAGRMQESAEAYRLARTLRPNSPVLMSDAAKPLVALSTPAALNEAKELLIAASAADGTYGQSWQLLAQVYSKTGDMGMAELSLAELAALGSNQAELVRHLDKAANTLTPYSPAGLRIEDLRRFVKQMKEREGKEKGTVLPFFVLNTHRIPKF